jgi:hypothetical protein
MEDMGKDDDIFSQNHSISQLLFSILLERFFCRSSAYFLISSFIVPYYDHQTIENPT